MGEGPTLLGPRPSTCRAHQRLHHRAPAPGGGRTGPGFSPGAAVGAGWREHLLGRSAVATLVTGVPSRRGHS